MAEAIDAVYDGFLAGFDDSYDVEAPAETETPDASVETDTAEPTQDTADPEQDTATEETPSAEEEDALAQELDRSDEDTTDDEWDDEDDGQTIAYTFNKRTTQLPLYGVRAIAKALGVEPQDVVNNLQKGANYDNALSKNSAFDGLVGRVKRYADMNELSNEDAINRTIDAMDVIESAAFIQELRAKYPDAPMNIINDMALMRAKQEAQSPYVSQREIKAEEARKEAWTKFFGSHPEVKADSLSERMLQAFDEGENPEIAYMYEQNAILQEKMKELEEKASKVQRSTGSSKKSSGAVGYDAFLEAYGY